MKLPLLFVVLVILAHIAHVSACSPQSKPQTPAKVDSNNKIPHSPSPATQIDDNKDGQVVAESMGIMIQALATFSQNPHNPVVAGACALQALGAFIKMLIQIFDEVAPTRTPRSEQEVAQWFIGLSKEKQLQIMQLMSAYIKRCKHS
jgi:hypothetical protein